MSIRNWVSVGILSIALIFKTTYSMAEVAGEDQYGENAKYYGAQLCAFPEFKCIRVKPGDSWNKLFPNERQREMVKRLNRTNMPISYRSWIVVPTNLEQIEYLDLSPFPATIKSNGERLVVVNLTVHAFAAYDENGKLVHWGPVSAGKGWCADLKRYCNTAIGSFRFVSKEGPECVSDIVPVETHGGAPMPYCMYYYRGFALHGSELPGFHASHGCIRLFKEDAQWLNQKFVDVGTPVIVTR